MFRPIGLKYLWNGTLRVGCAFYVVFRIATCHKKSNAGRLNLIFKIKAKLNEKYCIQCVWEHIDENDEILSFL